MARYIDAEKLIDKLFPIGLVGGGNYAINAKSIKNAIDNAPTADVAEVKYGKWISASKKQGVNIGMKCSLCGARIKYSEFFNGNHNFCHNCGAKMDGERKETQ